MRVTREVILLILLTVIGFVRDVCGSDSDGLGEQAQSLLPAGASVDMVDMVDRRRRSSSSRRRRSRRMVDMVDVNDILKKIAEEEEEEQIKDSPYMLKINIKIKEDKIEKDFNAIDDLNTLDMTLNEKIELFKDYANVAWALPLERNKSYTCLAKLAGQILDDMLMKKTEATDWSPATMEELEQDLEPWNRHRLTILMKQNANFNAVRDALKELENDELAKLEAYITREQLKAIKNSRGPSEANVKILNDLIEKLNGDKTETKDTILAKLKDILKPTKDTTANFIENKKMHEPININSFGLEDMLPMTEMTKMLNLKAEPVDENGPPRKMVDVEVDENLTEMTPLMQDARKKTKKHNNRRQSHKKRGKKKVIGSKYKKKSGKKNENRKKITKRTRKV